MIRQTEQERRAHPKESFSKADCGAQAAVEIARQTGLMDELVKRGGALLSVPFNNLFLAQLARQMPHRNRDNKKHGKYYRIFLIFD